jgi:hypothetical protein
MLYSHSVSKNAYFLCYFCNSEVTMDELKQVDLQLEARNSEDREFLLDNLPQSNNPRISPYAHQSAFEYEILNICWTCFTKAEKQFLNE